MMTPSLDRPADDAGPKTAIEAAVLGLDPEWMALADLLIGDGDDEVVADYVLMHPRRGIALIDVAPGQGGNPAAGFRNFLDHENFSRFFPGFLPIVALVISPQDAAMLGERLDDALEPLPPLDIVEPDWAEMVNTLLVASESPSSDQSSVAEHAEPLAEPSFAATAPDEPARRDVAPPFTVTGIAAVDPPRPRMQGPVADERFAPAEERRRWPAVAAVLILLVGGGVTWAALDPSLISKAIPSLAQSTHDKGPIETPIAAAPPAPTPAPAPPVAQDIPAVPPAALDSSAATPPPAAPPPVAAAPEPPPPVAAVQPPPAPTAPPPVAAVQPPQPAPVVQAPPPAPSVATVTEPPPAAPAATAPPAPAPAPPPVVKPAPRKAFVAKKIPPAADQAPADVAVSRDSRRISGAEATDALNRAELISPTQPLRVPPNADQADVAPSPRSFGADNPAPRQAAPVEDRTAALSPSTVSPPPATPLAPPFSAPASGASSRPTSLLPSRAAPGQVTTNDGLPQGASLVGDQSSGSDGRVCRIYNATKTVQGRPQAVTGLACKGGDGRWQAVTEAPAE
jgi:hypothetical protein